MTSKNSGFPRLSAISPLPADGRARSGRTGRQSSPSNNAASCAGDIRITLFDTFGKSLSLVAAGALSLAIVPWIVSFIEKLSIPGGVEIVFAKAERRVDAAQPVPNQDDIDPFKYLSGNDPNLAIALLRIQIERRLREIAEDVMLEPDKRGRPRSLWMLADDLAKQGAISPNAHALIRDLMPVMNEAVHGVALNASASDFALEYGPRILAMLRSPNA